MVFEERFARAPDQAEIWYRTNQSSGQPLVLCDGLGCGGFIWPRLVDYFQQRHRIIHYNYRGHGKSPKPLPGVELGIETNAADLEVVRKHARIRKKVVLVGHSLGVQVALEYYRRFPSRVKAIIALNGSHGFLLKHVHNTDIVHRLAPYLKSAILRYPKLGGLIWRQILGGRLALGFARLFEVNPFLSRKADLKAYFDHLEKMDPGVFFETLTAIANHSLYHELSTMTVPSLIVVSEKDRFTPPEMSYEMHRLLPNSQCLTIPTGSHLGPLELPELVNLRIEKFLAELARTEKPARKRQKSSQR